MELQVKFNIHPGSVQMRGGHGGGSEANTLTHESQKIAYINRELTFLEPLLLAYDDKVGREKGKLLRSLIFTMPIADQQDGAST